MQGWSYPVKRLCEIFHKVSQVPKFNFFWRRRGTSSKIIQARYGSLEDFPKNEPVVAPSDLAKSVLLEEVPRRLQKKLNLGT